MRSRNTCRRECGRPQPNVRQGPSSSRTSCSSHTRTYAFGMYADFWGRRTGERVAPSSYPPLMQEGLAGKRGTQQSFPPLPAELDVADSPLPREELSINLTTNGYLPSSDPNFNSRKNRYLPRASPSSPQESKKLTVLYSTNIKLLNYLRASRIPRVS